MNRFAWILSAFCVLVSQLYGMEGNSVIHERGDAGASVSDDNQQSDLSISDLNSMQAAQAITVHGKIHALGGGVRGFGVLAGFEKSSPRKLAVTRVTKTASGEPYIPVALIKVYNPQGEEVSVVDMTNQESGSKRYDLDIPEGIAGIWRFSIMGGRNGDSVIISFPKTADWGIRGEMSLDLNDSIPNPAYLYLPESVYRVAFERFGADEEALTIYAEDGTALGSPAVQKTSGRRAVLQINNPKAGSVLKIKTDAAMNCKIMIDGVPGLLCPTPEAAKKIKGGIVRAGKFVTAGPLQARARKWLEENSKKNLKVDNLALDWNSEDVARPEVEAQIVAALRNLDENLLKQNIDHNSPLLGSSLKKMDDRKEWDSFSYRLFSPWYAASLAVPAGMKSPVNPYYNNEVMVRRATMAALAPIVAMQGDDLVRENFLGETSTASYPIIHAFFVYSGLAEDYCLVKDVLDPEARAIWRQALLSIGDKLADFQGYQSNQWTHNLVGHLHTYKATGEKRFLRYFENQITAYIKCKWGRNSKFGQHPAGFYLEQYGADGNYGNMNLTSIVAFYYIYRNLPGAKPEIISMLKDSVERNLKFKSYFWLFSGNKLFCPTSFNSRRCESSLIYSNPAGDYLAHKEFDLAWSRVILIKIPSSGVYPASVFSYYAYTPEWGRRMLEECKNGKVLKGISPRHYQVYKDVVQSAKHVVLPVNSQNLFESLPGLIAAKSNGIYSLFFYDVDGASPKAKLLGFMEGGPTAISIDGVGTIIASMAPSLVLNKVGDEKDITFSCAYGYDSDNKLYYSGKSRAAAIVSEDKKSWKICSDFAGGKLDWYYRYTDDGFMISVCFNGSKLTRAWVNIPLVVSGDFTPQLKDNKLRIVATDENMIAEISANGELSLTNNLQYNKNSSVRCLRVPLAADGSACDILLRKINSGRSNEK